MKRKLTLEQIRELVRSRRTKGEAFMLSNDDYKKRQDKVMSELSKLTAEQIMTKWKHFCYDVIYKPTAK